MAVVQDLKSKFILISMWYYEQANQSINGAKLWIATNSLTNRPYFLLSYFLIAFTGVGQAKKWTKEARKEIQRSQE